MTIILINVNYIFITEFVKVVNMSGKLKSSRKQAAELHFDSSVQSLGK
jgi:hypothetical protein